MTFLTSTISDRTVVGWSQIVNEITTTIRYVNIKPLPATVTKDMDACFANYIFSLDFWMFSVQPNWSLRTTVIFRHLPFWDFSASIACEAIPSPTQTPITEWLLSSFPHSLRTTAGLVYRFISSAAAAVTATLCLRNNNILCSSCSILR